MRQHDPRPWAGSIGQATDQLSSSRFSSFSWPSPASPRGDCVRQSSWSAGPRPSATPSNVGDDEELLGRNNATRLEAATCVQSPLPNAPCRFSTGTGLLGVSRQWLGSKASTTSSEFLPPSTGGRSPHFTSGSRFLTIVPSGLGKRRLARIRIHLIV